MTKIDLKIIKTEKLLPEEISTLFTPTNEFDTIVERDNIFLIGPKGSGKSMILNYLSFPVQLERHRNKKLISFDKESIGIYIRCNEHYFGFEREKIGSDGRPTEYWRCRFTHVFNLTVCERLLEHFQSMKRSAFIRITNKEESLVCKEISGLFNLQVVLRFDDLQRVVREEIRRLSRDYFSSDIQQREFTNITTLVEVQRILQSTIARFKKYGIVILLDEYQELSAPQQMVISEMLSIRKPIFKIASLPVGLTIERQKTERSLDLTQDYQIVDLHSKNITPESADIPALKNFFVKMANIRLRLSDLTIEQLFPTDKSDKDKKKFSYSGLDNYVLLSSGNPKYFLDLLNLTISKWSAEKAKLPIPAELQESSVREFARRQIENIEYIPAISPYAIRAIVLKIGLLFQNYLKETKRHYSQIGIKDVENLSPAAFAILKTAVRHSILMEPSTERTARDGPKLYSITLNNSLLPYFDLPLQSHQVRELSSKDMELLIDNKSIISGTEIKLSEERILPSSESMDNYLGVIEEIANHVKKGKCFFFIGSGLSTEAGYPTGRELAKKIADYFDIGYAGEDISVIAKRVLGKRKQGDLIRYIKSVFEESRRNEPKSLSLLVDLNVDTIFTTNWDKLIEEQLQIKNTPFEAIARDETISISTTSGVKVFKLHGDFANPDKFVITEDDVHEIEKTRPLMIHKLVANLAEKHCIFIGYGMDDWDLKTVMSIVEGYQGKFMHTSYATAYGLSKDETMILESRGIIPLRINGEKLIVAIHKAVKKGNEE